MEIRLQKWLSQAGVASRRKAEELILAGQVAVNGVIVSELGAKADIQRDTVTVQGRACWPIDKKTYIALHKPEGVVTTVSDPYGRPTVMEYLPDGMHCYPVGRLDYDTSGLLILTSDGELAQKLAHPKHGVCKVYIATVRGVPSKEALAAFRDGVKIDGRLTMPAEIELVTGKRPVQKKEPNAKVRIKLYEGRNRQVRKMCEAIGHVVINLKRVEVGQIKLGSLPRGQWRPLTKAEVRLLSGV